MLSVWFRVMVGVPILLDQPVTLPELGVHVHVKRVPATFDVSVIFIAVLLQMLLLSGVFEMFGTGNTVTV